MKEGAFLYAMTRARWRAEDAVTHVERATKPRGHATALGELAKAEDSLRRALEFIDAARKAMVES